MLLSETGFTYGGRHSRDDMGLLYAEKDGHIAIPEIKRNSYSIAGSSGTVLLPGEARQTFNLEGTLYPAREPHTQAQAQALIRRVAAWLTAGRQQLIFDYEPAVYYLAELSAASKWSLKNWFGGELPVRWTAQPFAYSVEETSAITTITGTIAQLTLDLETGQPAGMKLTLENTGTAAITGMAVGGILMEELNLTAGQTLAIDCEPPVGAVIGNSNALPYATWFTPVMLSAGRNSMNMSVSYGSASGRSAKITISARGRW